MRIVFHFAGSNLTQKPLLLHIASATLLLYVVLDTALTFTDSRSNGQAVLFFSILVPSAVMCWRGNHFAYFFCVVISAFLLVALLSPGVRRYFKAQRAAWYQKQNQDLTRFDRFEPLFPLGGNVLERGAGNIFWRNGNELLIFLGTPLKGYRLQSLDQAHQLREKMLGMQKKNVMMALIGMPLLLGGMAVYVMQAAKSGTENHMALLLPMMLLPLLTAAPTLRMLRFQNGLRKELEPTQWTIKAMQLFELYSSRQGRAQKRTKNTAVAFAVIMLVAAAIFSVTVSPKIMEKRRQDKAAREKEAAAKVVDTQASHPVYKLAPYRE